MELFDPRAGRILFTVLVVAGALAFAWAAWHVLICFLFAIFFAYLLDPVVELLVRRLHMSRGQGIALVYLGVFAGLAALLLFIGPKIMHEGERLATTLPDLYEKVATGQIAWQIGAQHHWSAESRMQIQRFLAGHREQIVGLAQEFGTRLARLGRNAWLLVLVPILAIFFLKDGRAMEGSLLEMFERRRQRDFAEGVLHDVHEMLAFYIRTQLLLALISMAVYLMGLGLLRVPYAVVLGIVGGFMEFIPMVGPVVAALLFVGVALGAGYGHVLWLAVFLGAWRGAEDYVVVPRVMGERLQLHPLAVLFGVLAGAEVAGVIGVYLSIPVIAALRILWRRWRNYQWAETVEFPASGQAEARIREG